MNPHASNGPPPSAVTVVAPSRVHCALLNESGFLGRVDGSLGFSIKEPSWVIDFHRGGSGIEGGRLVPEHETAVRKCLRKLEHLAPPEGVRIDPKVRVPPHIGLGSKTALKLAIAAGICALSGHRFDAAQFAQLLHRGGTSGIGVHGFHKGGFLWDAGREFPGDKADFVPSFKSAAAPPRLILHLTADWLKIVHFRFEPEGLFGAKEEQLFRQHCPVSHSETREMLVATSTIIIPALLEKNEIKLQAGIARLQNLGLKRIEWSAQMALTVQFRQYWDSLAPAQALGLSSMGSTLYVATSDPAPVIELVRGFSRPPLHLAIAEPSRGAVVTEEVSNQ